MNKREAIQWMLRGAVENVLRRGWDFVSSPDVYTCIAAREFNCAVEDVSPLERACMKSKYFVFMYNSKR